MNLEKVEAVMAMPNGDVTACKTSITNLVINGKVCCSLLHPLV